VPITTGTHTDGGAVIRCPGSAWLEGTPAMDLGHMNVVLKWMYLYVGSVFRMWNFSQSSICILILNVGIVIICSIIIIFLFCFVLFCVLSGCCFVVMYLGCGMLFEMVYLYVGSGCRDRNCFDFY